MELRPHGLSDDERQRLAAARRNQGLAPTPLRASIGAIEIELRSLGASRTNDE